MATRLNFNQIQGLTSSLSDLESEILNEEYRVDSILDGSNVDLDSFGEVSIEMASIDSRIDIIMEGATSSLDSFSEVSQKIESLESVILNLNGSTSSVSSSTTQSLVQSTIYPSGTIQGFIQNHIYTGAQGNAILNELLAYPITIEGDIEISAVIAKASNQQSNSIIFGLYDVDSSGYPNNLVFEVTSFVTNTTTAQSVAISQVIPAGTYYVAINGNASNRWIGHARQNFYNTALGTQDLTYFLPRALNISYSYTGNLPSVFPSGASDYLSNIPGLWFQIA